MEVVEVKGEKSLSRILVGESIDNLRNYTLGKRIFIVTDKNVERLYKHRFPNVPTYAIEPGEGSKNLLTTIDIYRWLLESNVDRSSLIVGIGGGVVCDLTGFVASTYMRGVDFGFVSTTLLSQVDASVGGKNGVDLDGYKNIIGTFNQPKFVICDISMLKTLHPFEFISGMAEVVKHALIADKDKFDFIKINKDAILNLNIEMLEYLVVKSVKIKARIVEADEREQGVRRVLNLGHTWGHAVEKYTGMSHGYAVSIGLVFSANFSVIKGLMKPEERDNLVDLLTGIGLPLSYNKNEHEVFEILKKDKKKENDFIHFVLMNGIGNAQVEKIGLKEIEKFIQNGTL
ncbi:MAG TPA: 3-dehydroquinate synthase [Bacteroidales bacterium]|nr:3-dehydroquinate synthase [Bacteroidales bacterium]